MSEGISLTRQLGEAVARLYEDGMSLVKDDDSEKYDRIIRALEAREGYISIFVRLKDEFSVSGVLFLGDAEPDYLFELHASNVDAFGPQLTAVPAAEAES